MILVTSSGNLGKLDKKNKVFQVHLHYTDLISNSAEGFLKRLVYQSAAVSRVVFFCLFVCFFFFVFFA